jgi:hypothetical protein
VLWARSARRRQSTEEQAIRHTAFRIPPQRATLSSVLPDPSLPFPQSSRVKLILPEQAADASEERQNKLTFAFRGPWLAENTRSVIFGPAMATSHHFWKRPNGFPSSPLPQRQQLTQNVALPGCLRTSRRVSGYLREQP